MLNSLTGIRLFSDIAGDIISDMRNPGTLDDKLNEAGGAPERGYASWKRAKVEAALEQSQDRDAMIPVEKLLRDLGIER